MIRPTLVVAVLLSLAGAVQAQQPDSVIRGAPIRVHAVRPATTAGGASALTVSIDSLNTEAAPTLEQVLRETPLVTVRTNSRGEAQFSLRGSGSDARQVAVLVDGVPLNLGWDDRADLSVLPVTAATGLTLVRGLPSLLYGPNVLGGVVEVDVAHGARGTVQRGSAEARASVDNTGSFSLAALGATPVQLSGGTLSLRTGIGMRDRRGFALPRGIGDYGNELRTNTDMEQVDGFVAARYSGHGGAWSTLSASAFRASRGIAPELHTDGPRFWRYPHMSRIVAAVTGGTGDRASPLGGRGDMELSIGVDAGRTGIESYTDATYDDVADTEDMEDRTLTLRLLADQTIGSRGELRAAATLAQVRHDEVLSDSMPNLYEQRLWSVGLENVWRVAAARVSIGAAVDGTDTPHSGDKPALEPLRAWGGRVGITGMSAGGSVLWHAGASRRARTPSLRELYSGALGRFAPNPDLQPEVLTAAEAGITTQRGTGELQVVAFLRELDDAIEQVNLPDRKRMRVNLGTIRSQGAELLGSWSFGQLGATADLTLQRVRLLDSDVRPEYQPSLAGGVGVALPLPLALRGELEARYTGAQYCNNPNADGQLQLAPSGRLDAQASRVLTLGGGMMSRLEVSAGIDNVTDAAVYDQCGLPQPGRTLRLQLRAF